jgi:melibiose permease
MGLRMCMTIIPIVVLLIGLVVFKKNYILTDEKLEEITLQLEKSHRA